MFAGKPTKLAKKQHEQLADLLIDKQPVDVALYKSAMYDAKYDWTNQVATITHELGHSMKMSHAGTNQGGKYNPIDCCHRRKSIMEQGRKIMGYNHTI